MSVDKCGGQQAVGTNSISGSSASARGSGGHSSVYSSDISGDREFDSTLGHPGEDLGSLNASNSQLGGGSGNRSTPVAAIAVSDDSSVTLVTPVTTTLSSQGSSQSSKEIRAAATRGGRRMAAATPAAQGSSCAANGRTRGTIGSSVRQPGNTPSDSRVGVAGRQIRGGGARRAAVQEGWERKDTF